MQTCAKTKAILMISIGNRPWVHVCAETFKLYAARCDSDFCLETELPTKEDFDFPAMNDTPGRKFKIASASKAYFVWKYLCELGCEQLIVVDDTCCVRPTAVNLFEAISVGSCGGKKTARDHAEDSFNYIRNFIQDNDLEPLEYDRADYVNGGLMVYDKSMIYAFQPEKIIAAS